MMCGTNKAINAFPQGKRVKQEILHSETSVLHVIPNQFAQGLSELKGHKLLYRQSFQIWGLTDQNVLFQYIHIILPG